MTSKTLRVLLLGVGDNDFAVKIVRSFLLQNQCVVLVTKSTEHFFDNFKKPNNDFGLGIILNHTEEKIEPNKVVVSNKASLMEFMTGEFSTKRVFGEIENEVLVHGRF